MDVVSPTSVAAPCRLEDTAMAMMTGTGLMSSFLASASYRRDHQHCGHIVHESGDQPCKQGKRHHRPFDVGHFSHNDIRHQRGHA